MGSAHKNTAEAPSFMQRERQYIDTGIYWIALQLRYRLVLAGVRMIIRHTKLFSKFIDRHFDPNEIRKRLQTTFTPLYVQIQGIWGEIYYADINDHIGWRLYVYGYFDTTPPALVMLARSWNSGTYVDVGANIGSTSLPLVKNNIEVFCIEPNPRIASALKRNIAQNSPHSYTVVEWAVGSPDEVSRSNTTSIFSPNGNLGASSVNKHWNDSRVPSDSCVVPLSTLDIILDSHDIKQVSVLKIDIEGKEYEALQGFQNGFITQPAIIFEWRPDIGQASGKKVRDLRTLFPKNYVFWGISTRLIMPHLIEMRASKFTLEKSYENVFAIPQSLLEKNKHLRTLMAGNPITINISTGEIL